MLRVALKIRIVMAAALLLLLIATPALAQRYEALLRDGSTIAGERLKQRTDRSSLSLDGKSLLDAKNSIRVLRDTSLSVEEPREYIEFTNGDRLIGRAQAFVTGEAALPWGAHLVVEDTVHTGSVRVRLDWLRRIVAGPVRESVSGGDTYFIRLKDGREFQPRSVRWFDSGVRLLTDDGIVSAPFEQIADMRWPQSGIVSPLPGAAFLEGAQPKIARTVTSDGEVFTFPHTMLAPAPQRAGRKYVESESLLATRPPWALDTIHFDRESVAWQSFLNDDEMPLSLLPVVGEDHTAAIAHLPWRRNRSVHGRELQVGEMASELGIGMHSHSRVTFQLPEHAATFSSLVGLDRAAGAGGCVHCRIYRDEDEQPVWERNFLRGSDGAQTVGPIDIRGAKTLTLEVDFADKDRPSGADPLDIRDWVNWLLPTVTVDRDAPSFAARRQEDIGRIVPELEGWQLADDLLSVVTLRPNLHEKAGDWRMAVCSGKQPLVLEQQVHIDLRNAWLHVEAAAADMPGAMHEIRVVADSESIGPTMNGRIRTMDKGQFHDRVHILFRHPYQDVTLRVIASPMEESSRDNLKGVVFRPLRLQPLIFGLPEGGLPIEPDVPLTALLAIEAKCDGVPLPLRPGMVTERVELNVRGWNFDEGYGVPTGSEIIYALDPNWKRFVAIIGLAEGWKGAGPYQILIDDKLFWTSRHDFNRNRQGEQIDVELPQTGKTITLKLLGDDSGGAWAHAGFLTK